MDRQTCVRGAACFPIAGVRLVGIRHTDSRRHAKRTHCPMADTRLFDAHFAYRRRTCLENK
jgi:hypothetical protein